MINRQKAADAAQSLADHLLVTEHIKALQEGQKVLADGLKGLGDRLRDLEKDMAVLKAEARYEAVKEAQGVVTSVQSGFNQRMEEMAVKIAMLQAAHKTVENSDPMIRRLAAGLIDEPSG